MWNVSSRSGVATLRTAIHLILTYLLSRPVHPFGVDKMSSKLESDVCCRLQVAPSGESYEGKRRPGRKQWQTTARYTAWFTSSPAGWLPVHRDQLRAQRSVTSMGKLYLFLLSSSLSAASTSCWPGSFWLFSFSFFLLFSVFLAALDLSWLACVFRAHTSARHCTGESHQSPQFPITGTAGQVTDNIIYTTITYEKRTSWCADMLHWGSVITEGPCEALCTTKLIRNLPFASRPTLAMTLKPLKVI